MTAAAAAFGLDDLVIGQRAEFETVLTGDDVDSFAHLSGDESPLHIDAAFARERGFPDRVVHGAHLLALASRLVGIYLPGRNALLLALNASFAAPALPGTSVNVSGVVEQLSGSVRSAVVKLRVIDCNTKATLVRGRLTVGFTNEARLGSAAYD